MKLAISKALALTLALASSVGSLAASDSAQSDLTRRQCESAVQAKSLIPNGWREVVISVSDIDEWSKMFVGTLGWEIRNRGEIARTTLDAWGLPSHATGNYVQVANPGSETGFVRIIDLDGMEQKAMRSHDQAWESGGIFNFNLRVADIAELSRKLTDQGWQAPSDPVQFSFGPFVVREWIPRHRDSVRMALIERVRPALEGWPNLKTSSRTFNSTQIVSDMDKVLAFYCGVLGFGLYLQHDGASGEPGEHVLGMSREAMSKIVRQVRIVHPEGKNEGSIELLSFEGYSGRDFSNQTGPPNLGTMMLRFPVPDIDALALHLSKQDVLLAVPVTKTEIAPYGPVKTLTVQSPDGAWLEFFEILER